MTGRWKVLKLRRDEGDIPCSITLWSAGVQEECHSKVQDQLPQRPGSGVEKYGTKVQEDHRDQQSAAAERSKQIAFYTRVKVWFSLRMPTSKSIIMRNRDLVQHTWIQNTLGLQINTFLQYNKSEEAITKVWRIWNETTDIHIRDRPKLYFSFSAENETSSETDILARPKTKT